MELLGVYFLGGITFIIVAGIAGVAYFCKKFREYKSALRVLNGYLVFFSVFFVLLSFKIYSLWLLFFGEAFAISAIALYCFINYEARGNNKNRIKKGA